MSLLLKKCVPCEGGVTALSDEKVQAYMKEIPFWALSECGKSIKRSLKFKDFATALQFTNKVAQIAEEENHHPDIMLGWGYCDITLQTHAIGGLHENDFIVATKINGLPI